jgi:hypothetical protein
MNMGGDDDEVIQGTDEEVSTAGQGAEGQDGDVGAEEPELSAEHPDGEEDGGEQEVNAAQRQQPSRGENRIQRLANEAKAAREEAAAARREAEELRRSQQQASQHITEQQERERLALMTPEERTVYTLDKQNRTFQAQMNQMRMEQAVQNDKIAFDAKASVHPTYAKYQEMVEKEFQEHLAKGTPVQREQILVNLLGRAALSSASKARKAAETGQRRVAAQTVRPGSAKGDTASQRAKAGDSPEKRLAGQFI